MSNYDERLAEVVEQFRKDYITAAEICRECGDINKATLSLAVTHGRFPKGFKVGESNVIIWPRAEVEEAIKLWKVARDNRKLLKNFGNGQNQPEQLDQTAGTTSQFAALVHSGAGS